MLAKIKMQMQVYIEIKSVIFLLLQTLNTYFHSNNPQNGLGSKIQEINIHIGPLDFSSAYYKFDNSKP